MKKTLVALTTLLSLSAWSMEGTANDMCASAYRYGTQDVINIIEDFQAGTITAQEAGVKVSITTVGTTTVSAACAFASPEARKCAQWYKEIYDGLRSTLSAGGLLTGNQTDINAGFVSLGWAKIRLAAIDVKCM